MHPESSTRPTLETLQRLAASLLVIGFDGITLTETLRDFLHAGVAGVILFKRNVQDPIQVAQLLQDIQQTRPEPLPLLCCVDQEGGRVARLRTPLTEFPEMRWLGRTGDAELAARMGAVIAAELRTVGFNVNFAPVMDVDSNPDNPVIGARSLSHDPHEVARLGVPFMLAMQEQGMLPCAKHFPGHGDTRSDSHFELPELPHGLERLHQVELVPFKAAIQAGVPLIMTAHVRFCALDPEVPATLSSAVLRGLLRTELGFQGVIVSDDLEMKAVVEPFGIAESVRRGLLAGVDCFLICHSPERIQEAIQTLAARAEQDPEVLACLLESAERLRRLRAQVPLPEAQGQEQVLTQVGTPAHQAVAEEIRQRGNPSAPQRPIEATASATPPWQDPIAALSKPSKHFLDI